MEFLSSIKNAYDSIGSEISKTFDSSGVENKQKEIATDTEDDVDGEESSPPMKVVNYILFSNNSGVYRKVYIDPS